MKSPIFVFSLPRSGSTLLQRILMSHKDIASVAEPWLLLPFLYAHKQNGILSEFQQSLSGMAIEDFIKNLPNKERDYFDALRNFANTLYEKQCNDNEIYFLDKTPRYYFIISEIAKVFPNAKFIFLFRNPVHVYSSILTTWGDNRFYRLHGNFVDIDKGPKLLSEGYELLKEKSLAIQYEKFIENPEKQIENIFKYLELENDTTVMTKFFNQNTKGRMGDPTGVKNYKTIDSNTLKKWKETFDTPFRKKVIHNYINDIDEKVLQIQGYSKKDILNEIMELKIDKHSNMLDWFDYFQSFLLRKINVYTHTYTIYKIQSKYSLIVRMLRLK